MNADGTFVYSPNGYVGTYDFFEYTLTDGVNTSNTAYVYIAVYTVPVANDDVYTTLVGQELDVAAANGVLANATNADGNPLTAQLVNGPANGTLTFNTDGSFSYVPNRGFYGTDTFTYTAVNGGVISNTRDGDHHRRAHRGHRCFLLDPRGADADDQCHRLGVDLVRYLHADLWVICRHRTVLGQHEFQLASLKMSHLRTCRRS